MLLEQYRNQFDEELLRAVRGFGEKGRLRDACEYALNGKGKRLRPLIVLMTADALGNGLDVRCSALSVEFFHTASLIADDLPCMDNDDFRRCRPSLHKAFCETTAILTTYTLIAEGYSALYRNRELMKQNAVHGGQADEAALFCIREASRCAGLKGAAQGQFLDRFPPDASWEIAQQVILQKTATLFEMSFLFGWLFGGGNLSCAPKIYECAKHLGIAFQAADDLDDCFQDTSEGLNLTKILGKEQTLALFEEESALFKKSLVDLGLWTAPFQELHDSLRRNVFDSNLLR